MDCSTFLVFLLQYYENSSTIKCYNHSAIVHTKINKLDISFVSLCKNSINFFLKITTARADRAESARSARASFVKGLFLGIQAVWGDIYAYLLQHHQVYLHSSQQN